MSDRAIAVHSSNFPLCSFVRGDPECGNVPLTNFRTTTITPPVPTQPVRPPVQPNLIDFGAEEIVGGEIETATEGMEDISEPTDHQYNADMSDGPGPSRLVSTPSQGQNDLMASSSSRQFVSFTPDAEYEAAGTRFQALVAPTDHTSQSQIGRRPTQKRPIPQGESTSSAARRRSPDSDRFHISPQLREQLRIEMGAENQPEETPPTRQQTYGDQMRHRLRVALGGEDSPEEMPPSRHRTNSDHLRERLRLEFGVAEHPTDDVSSNSQSRLDIIERRSPRRPIPVSPPSVPQLVESGPTRLRLLPGGNRIPFGFGRGTTVTRLSQPNLPSNSLELDGEAEWQNIFSRIEGLANVLGVTDRDAKRSGAASPQDEIVRRQMDEMNIFTDTPNRPDLASYSTRLQTFTGIWATSKSQTAADMAAAGFYCTSES